ncbi:MAG TPA: hypothetical protein VMW10_07955 [Alphaproteobacteria bacterium]|nr:hypothetical protein [Alphaproteobacteria bacterium]
MRSYVSVITLGLAFMACHIGKIEAGSLRITQEDDRERNAYPKTKKEIKADEIQKNVSSIMNDIFSSGNKNTQSAKGKEKNDTREIDSGVFALVEGLYSSSSSLPTIMPEISSTKDSSDEQIPLRAWKKLPSVAKVNWATDLRSWVVSRQTEKKRGKKRKLEEVAEDSKLLDEAVKAIGKWGQEGTQNYIGAKYGSPSLRPWAKRARTLNEVMPRGLKEYIELRNEQIRKKFPSQPIWIGKKTKGKTLVLDLEDLTNSGSSESDYSDTEEDYDDYADYHFPNHQDL